MTERKVRFPAVLISYNGGQFKWIPEPDGTFRQLVDLLQRLDQDTGDPEEFVLALLREGS